MADEAITITGLREVQANLYKFSQQLGDRVVYGALRQGANLIRKAIQQQVPVKTGKLKRGFLVARSKIHRGKLSTDMIGIYLTLRKGKNSAYYGRFLNDGWQHGKTKIPGKHFIQTAFEANKETALRLIISDAQAGADLLARKVGLL